MGFKLDSLLALELLNLNVFEYREFDTYTDDLRDFISYPTCSIRCDSVVPQNVLPFYPNSNEVNKMKIWLQAQSNNQQLLCAQGIKAFECQICNIVWKLSSNMNWIVEYSFENVPLRMMYDKPTKHYSGSVLDNFKGHEDYKLLETLATEALRCNIMDRQVEATLFSQPVGKRNEKFIYWQIQ